MLKENNLTVKRKEILRSKRTPKGKPKAVKPNEFWGTDMTKICVKEIGWVYITVVLDWYTKKVVGQKIGVRSKSEDWMEAMESAIQVQFPNGVRDRGLKVISDNGCQPTESYRKNCKQLGIEQIFTSYNNPKGNAETERFMRTMKEELLWLKEWKSLKELEEGLNEWIKSYNEEYLHSSNGYRPPNDVENEYLVKMAA